MLCLLQATWLLVQAAHAGPHSLRILAASSTASKLAGVLHVLRDNILPDQHSGHAASVRAVLRNVTWVLLMLCDDEAPAAVSPSVSGGGLQPRSSAMSTATARAVGTADCLTSLCWVMASAAGDGAGMFAAAVVSCLARGRLKGLSAQVAEAAGYAVLQPEALQGLCTLLASGPQSKHQGTAATAAAPLEAGVLRAWEAARALSHHLVTAQPLQLVRCLVEQRLMGPFLAVAPKHAARLLVCHVVSSNGQQVLCNIEEAFEVDVPLALVQVLLAPGVHMQLSHNVRDTAAVVDRGNAAALPDGAYPVADGNSTAISSSGTASSDDAASAQAGFHAEHAAAHSSAGHHDMFTDVLAGRLLLQRQRLRELLHASSRDASTAMGSSPKQQPSPQQQLAQPNAQPPQPWQLKQHQPQQRHAWKATAHAGKGCIQQAVMGLMAHLTVRDLQLQHQQRLHGASLSSSSITYTSSRAGSHNESSWASDECTNGHHAAAAAGIMDRHALLDGLGAAIDHGNMRHAAQQQPQCRHSYKAVLPRHHDPGGPPPYHAPPACAFHSLITADTCSPVCPECQSGRSCSTSHAGNNKECSSSNCSSGHTLLFGTHRLWLSSAQFTALCAASKLLRLLLGNAPKGAPISLLRIPSCSDADNHWVVINLVQWLEEGQGALSPELTQEQVARLWVSADFLQVGTA